MNYRNLTPNVFQSSYNKTPAMSMAKPQTTVWKPPSTNLYKSAVNAVTPPRVAQPKPIPVKTPQMSVEVKKPTAPKVIQGSGMTGQYASNPTNYVPPKTTPPPTNMNDWLSGTKALQARTDQFYNTSEAKRMALAQKQYDDAVALQNEMFANANNDLRGEIPRLDERMGKFEAGVRDNIAQADVIGAENKAQAQTYTGDAQRTAMQNKRQTDAQREKQYAALGTIDSYGTGSFTQGNANADTEFNRGTQQRYDALAQNLTEIDRAVTGYKTEALALIDTEKAKYEEQVRQINRQLRDNDVARREAIQQAYNVTQEAINNISDQYEGLRLTAEKDKLTFQQEMDKIAYESTMPNSETTKAESDLRNEYFIRTKDNKYNEVAQSYQKILKSEDSAAGDLGLVFSYMKLLDPTSTVREGEFANAQNATGVPSQILNAYNRALTGERINPAQREDFRKSALAYVSPVINQQKQIEEYFRQLALQQGINPERVIGGYGSIQTQDGGVTNSNDPLGLGI